MSLYEQQPHCEAHQRDKGELVDRGLVAVHVTFRDVYGARGVIEVDIGPMTLDAECIEAYKRRGFAVTMLRTEELAPPEILLEVAP
jgi:hypothetical protein